MAQAAATGGRFYVVTSSVALITNEATKTS
jgi:hypothetical protein